MLAGGVTRLDTFHYLEAGHVFVGLSELFELGVDVATISSELKRTESVWHIGLDIRDSIDLC
jgi:hypothetical protein